MLDTMRLSFGYQCHLLPSDSKFCRLIAPQLILLAVRSVALSTSDSDGSTVRVLTFVGENIRKKNGQLADGHLKISLYCSFCHCF